MACDAQPRTLSASPALMSSMQSLEPPSFSSKPAKSARIGVSPHRLLGRSPLTVRWKARMRELVPEVFTSCSSKPSAFLRSVYGLSLSGLDRHRPSAARGGNNPAALAGLAVVRNGLLSASRCCGSHSVADYKKHVRFCAHEGQKTGPHPAVVLDFFFPAIDARVIDG